MATRTRLVGVIIIIVVVLRRHGHFRDCSSHAANKVGFPAPTKTAAASADSDAGMTGVLAPL